MHIRTGKPTKWGQAVEIDLTGDDVALAIYSWLVAHGVHISGARTIAVNGAMIQRGSVYVDPSGFLVYEGNRYPAGDSESNASNQLPPQKTYPGFPLLSFGGPLNRLVSPYPQ